MPKFKRGTTHIQLRDVAIVRVFIRKATSVNIPMPAKEDQLVLQKNPEVNYKKIDKPDELLNEDLKLENEWQQVSTLSQADPNEPPHGLI